MKTPLAHRVTNRHGFTLVELLVVMGIIAILAAVSMSVGTVVLNMAKRTKAANTATQIQTAALQYYTEYSVYPTPVGAASGDFGLTDSDTAIGTGTAGSWGKLIQCLSGMISPSAGTNVSATETLYLNSRQIAFLTFKASDVDNGTTSTTLKDTDAPLNPLPYATTAPYFNIVLDGDYSGVIGPSDTSAIAVLPNFSGTFTPTSTPTGGSTTAGIAVWANCNYKTGMNSAGWYVHTF